MRRLLVVVALGGLACLVLTMGSALAQQAPDVGTSTGLAQVALQSADVPGYAPATGSGLADLVPDAVASYAASWLRAGDHATIFDGLSARRSPAEAHDDFVQMVSGLLGPYVLRHPSDRGPQDVGDEDDLIVGTVPGTGDDAISEQVRVGNVTVWVLMQSPAGTGSPEEAVALARTIAARVAGARQPAGQGPVSFVGSALQQALAGWLRARLEAVRRPGG